MPAYLNESHNPAWNFKCPYLLSVVIGNLQLSWKGYHGTWPPSDGMAQSRIFMNIEQMIDFINIEMLNKK